MTLYTVHREEGFYPLECETDEEAAQEGMNNPGTLVIHVCDCTNRIVFPLPQHNN